MASRPNSTSSVGSRNSAGSHASTSSSGPPALQLSLSTRTIQTSQEFKDLVRKIAGSWCDSQLINSLPMIYGSYQMQYYVDLCKGVIQDHKYFTVQDEKLIHHIRSEKNVDSIVFMALKYRIEWLSEKNPAWIDSFSACGGIKMLVDKLISIQSIKLSFSKYHARAVFQIVHCIKLLIQLHGVAYVISAAAGTIHALVMCLDFVHRPLVIEVLEILGVILYTRDADAINDVKAGIKYLAKVRNEKQFACFTKVMLLEDTAMKSAVLQFINNLFWGQEDICCRIEDRVLLEAAGFTAACEEAIATTCSKSYNAQDNYSRIKHSSLRKKKLSMSSLKSLQTIQEKEDDGSGDDAGSDYGELEDEEDDDDMGVILSNYDLQLDITLRAKVSGVWSIIPEEPETGDSEFRSPNLGFSECALLLDTWVEIRGLEVWFWEQGSDYNTQPPTVKIPVRMLESIDYYSTHAEIQMKFEFSFCLCFQDGSKIHCGFDDIEEMDEWSENLHSLIDAENELKCVFPSMYNDNLTSVAKQLQVLSKKKRLLKLFLVYQRYDANDRKLVATDLADNDFLCENPSLIHSYIELRLLLLDSDDIRYNVMKTLSTIAVSLASAGNRQPAFILSKDDIDIEDPAPPPLPQVATPNKSGMSGKAATAAAATPDPESDDDDLHFEDALTDLQTVSTDSIEQSNSSKQQLAKILKRNSTNLRRSLRRFSISRGDNDSANNSLEYFTPKERERRYSDSLDDEGSSNRSSLNLKRSSGGSTPSDDLLAGELVSTMNTLDVEVEEEDTSSLDSDEDDDEGGVISGSFDEGDGTDAGSASAQLFKSQRRVKALKLQLKRMNSLLNNKAKLADAIGERTATMWDDKEEASTGDDEETKDLQAQEAAAIRAANRPVSSGISGSNPLRANSSGGGGAAGVSGRGPAASTSGDSADGLADKTRGRRVSFGANIAVLARHAEGTYSQHPLARPPSMTGLTISVGTDSPGKGSPGKGGEYDIAMFKNMKESIRRKMYMQGYSKDQVDQFIGDGSNIANANANANASAPSSGANTPMSGNSSRSPMVRFDNLYEDSEVFGGAENTEEGSVEGGNPAASALAHRSIRNMSPTTEDNSPGNAVPASAAAAEEEDSLSPQELTEKYAKYYMQRIVMKRPPAAVRAMMQADGLPVHEIDRFINLTSTKKPVIPVANESPERPLNPIARGQRLEDSRYEKFRSMQTQSNMPEAVIRQKMKEENISEADQNAFFAEPTPSPQAHRLPPPPPEQATTAAAEEAPEDLKFEKYRKMQKLRLPEGAIRQKMSSEGISASDIEAFFQGKVMSSSSASTSTDAGTAAAPASAGGEDAKFEKFRKMQKMSLPEGAIRQKMMTEGIPAAEIDQFFSGPVPASGPAASAPTAAAGEDPKFEKFRKMQKMSLPEGAIRQKMTTEGIATAEIDQFFSGPVPSAAAAPAASEQPAEDPKFAKFRKMQTMHMPDGAIRQKMTSEGISVAEQDAFFSGKLPAAPAQSAAASDANGEAAKFEKYRKMQKMSMPEGAVRQKMSADGITVAEQDAFFAGKIPAASAGAGATQADSSADGGAASKAAGADDRFAKFRNMVKMKMPEGAIRQKMITEGLSNAEITEFLASANAGAAGGGSADDAADLLVDRAKHQPSRKMRNVFITKMPSKHLADSLWTSVTEISCDWDDLENNFGDLKAGSVAKPSPVPGSISGKAGGSTLAAASTDTGDAMSPAPASKPAKPALLSLFDGKRTQNTSIFITSVRKSAEVLYDYAVSMSPEHLTKDLTMKLLLNIPTDEESSMVASYDPELLDATGKLFKKLSLIPRLKQRLDIQLIIFNWDTRADEIVGDLNTLTAATNEVNESLPLLKQAFSAILSVVNYLNAGTARAQAVGLKIEDLVSK
jgi:hypothetical protein